MLTLIVAYSQNRVIGNQGHIPWHIPSDFTHFKTTTMGHPIIMGRKTWESLPKALPGRANIVISRQPNYVAENASVYTDWRTAIAAYSNSDPVFIIGGAALYQATLPFAHRLIATEIQASINGDVYFPALTDSWQSVHAHPLQEDNGYSYKIVEYEQRTPLPLQP